MTFNPTRFQKIANRNARHRPTLNDGIHSTANQSKVMKIDSSSFLNREATEDGWKLPLFSGKDFEFYYKLLSAGNHSGKCVNNKGDLCIFVLSGKLFFGHDKTIDEIKEGQSLVIERGTEFELSSAGRESVELLISQSSKYDNTLKILSAPEAVTREEIKTITGVNSDLARGNKELTKQQAINIGNKRTEHTTRNSARTRPPLPGQIVEGASPRPVGPAGFAD